jgi:hypothetical protein
MRRQTLGDRLRAIVLSTPFVAAIAAVGCQPNPCAGWADTRTLVLGLASLGDAGGIAALPDGGTIDGGCFAACATIWYAEYGVAGGDGLAFPYRVNSCRFQMTDGGEPGVSCTVPNYHCVGGRLPFTIVEDVTASRVDEGRVVGAFFARAARLEAASVHAFRILARELQAHGAPARLVAEARQSALDEVRHTRLTSALARRYGAKPLRPVLRSAGEPRALETVALENAVEGCARETYGAAVGLWQARHAIDPEVRTALESIAGDEVRHAELSWEVASWAEPCLASTARARLAQARAKAFDQLEREAAAHVPSELVARAGLPPPEVATQLVAAVREAIA